MINEWNFHIVFAYKHQIISKYMLHNNKSGHFNLGTRLFIITLTRFYHIFDGIKKCETLTTQKQKDIFIKEFCNHTKKRCHVIKMANKPCSNCSGYFKQLEITQLKLLQQLYFIGENTWNKLEKTRPYFDFHADKLIPNSYTIKCRKISNILYISWTFSRFTSSVT